jgi:hypothetical protein
MFGLFFYCVMPNAFATVTHISVGDSIQTAFNDATPGDIIVIAEGTYNEDLSTESGGSDDAPILVRAAEDATVIITALGEVLQIDHPYWTFEDIIFDGQFGSSDTIDINDGADHTRLTRVEVRRSGRDCIDMGAPSGVTIEDSKIHQCLWFDDDDDERRDAHGVTGGAVTNLTIKDTVIHTFSGDAIQFDPGRWEPGWNNIRISGCQLWLEPLAVDLNGFLAGQVPGENAIDTKTFANGERASLVVEDTEVWGFRDGVDFSNQAAFLIKENVDAVFRRVVVHDSEIAFRLRGPTDIRPQGAWVTVENSLIYDVEVAVRFEDNLEQLSMVFTTFGMGIDHALVEVESYATVPDIRNSLFVEMDLPSFAAASDGNVAATSDALEDPDGRDHHLTEGASAIDAGILIEDISEDLDGGERFIGEAPDAGAYEYGQSVEEDTGFDDLNDTGDSAENDTGTDLQDDGPPEDEPPEKMGIGAAESVGEKGGCGCSGSPNPPRIWPWILVLSACLTRRKMTTNVGSMVLDLHQ